VTPVSFEPLIAALLEKHHYTPAEVRAMTPYQAIVLVKDAEMVRKLTKYRLSSARVRALWRSTGLLREGSA